MDGGIIGGILSNELREVESGKDRFRNPAAAVEQDYHTMTCLGAVLGADAGSQWRWR
jgi:hypothetical protein